MVQRGTLLSSLIEVNMLTAATGASDDTGTVSSLLEKTLKCQLQVWKKLKDISKGLQVSFCGFMETVSQ